MDADEIRPGGRVLYPGMRANLARVVIHLCRAEARKGGRPALFAVCPGGIRLGELDPVPMTMRPRWWRRKTMWCPSCRPYLEHINAAARDVGRI